MIRHEGAGAGCERHREEAGGKGSDRGHAARPGMKQKRKPAEQQFDRGVMEEIGAEADFADERDGRVDEDPARLRAREGEDEEGKRQGGCLCHPERPRRFSRPLRKRRPREREEGEHRECCDKGRDVARHDPPGGGQQEENHRAEGENRHLVGKPEIENILDPAPRIGLPPEGKPGAIGENGEGEGAEREPDRAPEGGHRSGDERKQRVKREFHADAPAAGDHRPLADHRRRGQRVPEIDEAIGEEELPEIEAARRRVEPEIEEAAEIIGRKD